MNAKVCFVIMGFGKKTDYESGRTLDLDATYEAIIKPAVVGQNFKCIRADDIMHSGVIDVHMFEMLLRADLVIADISTGNVNAVYELGVRHALRPYATIIIKEDKGRLYFDLSHVNIFPYTHLGEDIGSREAKRASEALGKLIGEISSTPQPDSPVYAHLPFLQQPVLTDGEYQKILKDIEQAQYQISQHLKNGEMAIANSDMVKAHYHFSSANSLKPADPFILQKLILSTYKSKLPDEITALKESLKVLSQLEPDDSNDPETLGLAGAIFKRLWSLEKDGSHLDKAIQYYGRGFELRRDYYNGENLANCHILRSRLHTDSREVVYDQISAKKVREELVGLLGKILIQDSFEERSDKHWIYATMANCCFGLGRNEEGSRFESLFLNQRPAKWEISTYFNNKPT